MPKVLVRRGGRLLLVAICLLAPMGAARALSPRNVALVRSKLDAAQKACTDPDVLRRAVSTFVGELVTGGLPAGEEGKAAFLAARGRLETTAKTVKKPGGMTSFFVLKVRLLGDTIVEAAVSEGGTEALRDLPGALGLPPIDAPPPPDAGGDAVAEGGGVETFAPDRAQDVTGGGGSSDVAGGDAGGDTGYADGSGAPAHADSGGTDDGSTGYADGSGAPAHADSGGTDDGSVDDGSADDTAPPPPPPGWRGADHGSAEATADGRAGEGRGQRGRNTGRATGGEGPSSDDAFDVAYEDDPVRLGYERALASAGVLSGPSKLLVRPPAALPCRYDLVDAATDALVAQKVETDRQIDVQAGVYHVFLDFEGARIPRFNTVVSGSGGITLTWPAPGTLQLARSATGATGAHATLRDSFSGRAVRESLLPGQRQRLPEGTYTLELVDGAGNVRRGSIAIRAGKVATIRP